MWGIGATTCLSACLAVSNSSSSSSSGGGGGVKSWFRHLQSAGLAAAGLEPHPPRHRRLQCRLSACLAVSSSSSSSSCDFVDVLVVPVVKSWGEGRVRPMQLCPPHYRLFLIGCEWLFLLMWWWWG